MTDFRETPGTTEDVAARAADSMAFLSDVERKAREACNYEVSDAYQNAWLVIRDQRATIERLERALKRIKNMNTDTFEAMGPLMSCVEIARAALSASAKTAEDR